ncbi:hypothetical protein ACRRTK_019943 [Alexandromys fortis]
MGVIDGPRVQCPSSFLPEAPCELPFNDCGHLILKARGIDQGLREQLWGVGMDCPSGHQSPLPTWRQLLTQGSQLEAAAERQNCGVIRTAIPTAEVPINLHGGKSQDLP